MKRAIAAKKRPKMSVVRSEWFLASLITLLLLSTLSTRMMSSMVSDWFSLQDMANVYAQNSNGSENEEPENEVLADDLPSRTDFDEMPTILGDPLRALLVGDAQADQADSEASGLLSIMIAQLDIAIQHTGFLQDSLSQEDLPEVRRHTEHIVNILDGEEGSIFGDLDRDGQVQNPGDGVGARVYFIDAAAQVDAMQQDDSSTTLDAAQTVLITEMKAPLEVADENVNQALEGALKIFASDSITEAIGFADELTTQVIALHDDALLLLDAGTQLAELASSEQTTEPSAVRIESTLLADLAEQIDIAVQHTDFLQNSLTEDDLPEVRRHTEHVINILDGEDGEIYGDLDRDGQEQNPGNGFGVRVYFGEIDNWASNITTESSSLSKITTESETAQAEIQDAFSVALRIFAADTIAEAQVSADELTTTVATIQQRVSQIAAADEALAAITQPAPSAQILQQIELSARTNLDVLVDAEEQGEIAVQHTGFLQEAITASDIVEMRRHTEHIVNILDGEDGAIFGDLDRDGQVQNPGNGIGLRFYLDESLRQFPALADVLDGASPSNEVTASALVAAQSITESRATIDQALTRATQIFAADTVDDGQIFADELTILVTDIQQSITDSAQQLMLVAEATSSEVANATEEAASEFILPPASPEGGDVWINPADESTYLFVDAGSFTIGAADDEDALSNEKPAHSVSLPGFWIQQTETTNQQYGDCVSAGICTPPQNDFWEQPEFAEHPVTHVDWQQATAYASWLNAKLPSEAQWEKACRGSDDRIYPWGDALPTDELTNFDNAVGSTEPVGSYPDGASPVGALDMSGNVYEWTSSLNAAYPYVGNDGRESLSADGRRVVRGGSYYYTQYQIRCSARVSFSPTATNAHFGFRLVYEQNQNRWLNPADEALYIKISGGAFTMGSTAEEAVLKNEEPQHQVTVDDFWLQQTETTNAQYQRCVDAGVCESPSSDTWDQPEFAQHPVTNITWEQANTYAEWVGGRLPTEAEWESACSSADGHLYPWGNEPPSSQLSNFDNTIGEAVAVGSYPEGATLLGLLDMSGNVFEWTSSLNAEYPYAADDGREDQAAEGKRIIRGGSYFYTQHQLRCTARTILDPTLSNSHVGLRVAIPID